MRLNKILLLNWHNEIKLKSILKKKQYINNLKVKINLNFRIKNNTSFLINKLRFLNKVYFTNQMGDCLLGYNIYSNCFINDIFKSNQKKLGKLKTFLLDGKISITLNFKNQAMLAKDQKFADQVSIIFIRSFI